MVVKKKDIEAITDSDIKAYVEELKHLVEHDEYLKTINIAEDETLLFMRAVCG